MTAPVSREGARSSSAEEHQQAARRLSAFCRVCPSCGAEWLTVEAEIDAASGLPVGTLCCAGGCRISIVARNGETQGTLEGRL